MRVMTTVVRTGLSWLIVFGIVSPGAARTNDPALAVATETAPLRTPVISRTVGRATLVSMSGTSSAQDGDVGKTAEAGLPVAVVDTNLATRPLVKGDLRTFDISGFKLGMSPGEVQRIAAAAHLVTSDGSRKLPFDPEKHGTRGASFQLLVARAAAVRLNRPKPAGPTVVNEALLYGAEDDRYHLVFLPMEEGPRLTSILLITSPKGNTPQSYLDAVTAKYGKAPVSKVDADGASARWCTRGDVMCEDLPAFTARMGEHQAEVSLRLGDRELIALNKRIEAAGAAAAASMARKPTL